MGLEESSGGKERGRETDGQKGKEKIRSLIKVVCASTRNVRGAVRETFKPDDGSKDTPADLKFPQRPLRNNVTTAVYRTADLRASLFIVQFPSRDFRDGTVFPTLNFCAGTRHLQYRHPEGKTIINDLP